MVHGLQLEAPLQTRGDLQPYDNNPELEAATRQLVEVGMLTPMADLDLHHGRAIAPGDRSSWRVNPMYEDPKTNWNKITALSVGSHELATTFANVRANQIGATTTEILRIVSNDPGALIMDGTFRMDDLSATDEKKVRKALHSFAVPLTAGSPLSFEDRDALKGVRLSEHTPKQGYLEQSDIDRLAKELRLKPEVAQQILTAFNTRKLLEADPVRVARRFLRDEPTVGKIPINPEYVSGWLRRTHVAGVQIPVQSGTLGKRIEPVFLFDLGLIQTDSEQYSRQQQRLRTYGGLAIEMARRVPDMRAGYNEFKELITMNLHASPRAIIESAMKVSGEFARLFKADAGNKREGYTVGEHTETVLRAFDANFANLLPAGLLPIMRLALVTHDIGKGQAVLEGEKHKQGKHNAQKASEFMDAIKTPPELQRLVMGMTGEAQKQTTSVALENDPQAYDRLERHCRAMLLDYDPQMATEGNVRGLVYMCFVIQTCDSIAYTTHGITRANGVHYRNFDAFNESFVPYTKLRGENAGLKGVPTNLV